MRNSFQTSHSSAFKELWKLIRAEIKALFCVNTLNGKMLDIYYFAQLKGGYKLC